MRYELLCISNRVENGKEGEECSGSGSKIAEEDKSFQETQNVVLSDTVSH